VVSSTPRPHFTPGKDPVPILQEDGRALGPVWTGGKSRPHRDSIPDRPARSQSLYRLSYPANDRRQKGGKTFVRISYCFVALEISWFCAESSVCLLQVSLCDEYSLPVDFVNKRRPHSFGAGLANWTTPSPNGEKVTENFS